MTTLGTWGEFMMAVENGPPGGLLFWSLALVFAAVGLGVLGLAGIMRDDPALRRMVRGAAPREAVSFAHNAVRGSSGAPEPWEDKLQSLLGIVPGYRVRQAGLRARLARAGFESAGAARTYILIRVGAFIAGTGGAFATVLMLKAWLAPAYVALAAGAVLAAGVFLPGRWVAWRVAERRARLANGFPDALDMMVVCVEAGLGLDAALSRVGGQIGSAHPFLASELDRVARELRAGQNRATALRNMARRADVPDIAAVVTLLVQSDMLGTSVARALRVHAEEMRAARLLRAEERAHALPVKLTVPLVVCILPALLAVVLLPGVIAIIRDVLPHVAR